MSLDAVSPGVVALESFDALIAAAESACDAATRLIEHREAFLGDSEKLAGRGFVVAGKSVNFATAVAVGGMLLVPAAAAAAAAPVVLAAGITLGVVGAGSSLAASAHDSDIDARCADVLKSVPDFFKKDEQLREGLQALYQDFHQLLQIPKYDVAGPPPLDTNALLFNAGAGFVANLGAVAVAADAATDVAQAATKVAFSQAFGITVSALGACLAFKDLWDAVSKQMSWAGLRQDVSSSTEEVRRLRQKLTNFVDLAGMLTTASPPPQRGANLGRLLAVALTRDMEPKDMFEWAALKSDMEEVLRFDFKTSRIYSLAPRSYGKRGGRTYFKPSGWVRYSREIPNFEQYADWCVAYHGTRPNDRNIKGAGTKGVQMRLLAQGLHRPDKPRPSWQGQTYSTSGRSLYVSPSVEYAAQYSNCIRTTNKEPHWVQVVFQCRVRPGKFRVEPSTLRKRWDEHLVRHDPNFKNSELEWLIEAEADIIITGMMVREVGPAADPGIYGEIATEVREDFKGKWGEGPFFHYMWLRHEELRTLTEQGKVPPP